MPGRRRASVGSKLVAAIKRDLADGLEFDQRDLATLDLIAATRDDIARLETQLDDVFVQDVAGTRKLNAAYVEVRLARAQLHRLMSSLKLSDEDLPAPKSARHQSAAHARWNRGVA
ncbi:hypothetical protein [Nocardia salmonicida]|uniref:hypothetical protein n=1 Tax=Nocardia salmonicida TaxID=53431 RepID=UPI003640044B